MGKYSEFLSQTPKVSPKIKLFAIYTLNSETTSIALTFIWECPFRVVKITV